MTHEETTALVRRANASGFETVADYAVSLEGEVERLREIERAFNEGWLPPLPGEPAVLRLRSLHDLRKLIPGEAA